MFYYFAYIIREFDIYLSYSKRFHLLRGPETSFITVTGDSIV